MTDLRTATRRRGLLLGALAMACHVLAAAAPPPPGTPVEVNEVIEQPLEQTVALIGHLVARETGAVSALVEGPLLSIDVNVGDRVVEGDRLALLDNVQRRAELDRREAEASVQRARIGGARARLELAAQDLERLGRLRNTPAFPKAAFEDQEKQVVRSEAELVEAQAALRKAEAERRIAQVALERTEIRAPYGGVVLRRHTAPGIYLQPGDRLVTMLNDRDFEIEVDVPVSRLAGLAPGTEAAFSTEHGLAGSSEVRAIIPDENPATRTRPVRLRPRKLPAGPFANNQSVTVHVPVGTGRMVVSVHKDAVINRGGQRHVFVVQGGEATIRPVRLGEAIGGRFEVIDGLEPGELVVVRGNERLRPGQKVRYELGS